jgi:hypothetical protein
MDVVSLSALRVSSVLWQPQRGGYALTVVAKATFRLLPGEARLAEEQEYPNDDDNHWNDDPARSLYSPTDLVPFKARPEVMLVGHAFAPRKEPVRSLIARILIGEVDKVIEVTGDRAFTHDGQLREPARFVKMPLRYERAAGGPDTFNPVGVRYDARPDAYGAVPLPNLLPVGTTVTSRSDIFPPVAFAPVAPAWPSRRQKLGRHATRFLAGAWSAGPLPEDIDPSYFNAAPEDQRPAELRDNERIVLENLHADHPRLVTNLPGIRPCAFAELPGRAPQRLHMACDTLWIDTDRSICTLTWRGQVPLESGAQPGRVLIALEEGQKRLAWSDLQRLQPGAPASSGAQGDIPLVDVATVDEPLAEPHDSGRAALLGMASSVAVMAEKPVAFIPPIGQRGPESSRPRTLPVTPRRPMTLTDVNLSADLPFLRAEREAREAAESSRQSPPQGALPFASQAPLTEAAEVPPPAFPRSAPPPSPPPPSAASMLAPVSDSPWAAATSRPEAPAFAPAYDPTSARSGSSIVAPVAPSPSSPAPPMPSPVAPAVVAAATIGGAVAASNAAASAIAPPAPATVPRAARGSAAREIVDLLWFDPAVLPKVREHPRFKEILAEISPKPRSPSFDNDPFDDVARDDEPDEIKDRREIFGVVARAESIDAEGVGEAMAEAVSDDGTFIPPLVLLAGELTFIFDELSALKATVAATSPFAASDKKLKETLDMVGELLQTPWIQGSTGVAEGLVQRLKEAFSQGVRTLPPSYLDSHTERMLLEQRSFQKRTVFGEPHLRTLLAPLGVQAAIPTYLPGALANKLPMVLRMRVRVLAEAHLPQDQYETYPASLKAVAIGRVSPLPGRR